MPTTHNVLEGRHQIAAGQSRLLIHAWFTIYVATGGRAMVYLYSGRRRASLRVCAVLGCSAERESSEAKSGLVNVGW
jgi:hypothetical protein